MTRSIAVIILAPLLLLALGSALSAQQREVVQLRFEGAESLSRSELGSAIITSQTRCPNLLYELVCWAGVGREPAYLDPAVLESDVLRLRVYYHERGFRAAAVRADTVSTGRGVRVVFRIAEGVPVRVSDIQVDGAPEPLDPRRLPLGVGEPFDVLAYEAGRDTLLARLRNHGYAHAQVLLSYEIKVTGDQPLGARVRYDVVPGQVARFGEIMVTGNHQVSPNLVKRMLTFREGGVYDRSALLESQRNLYGLQIFRHAEVRAELGGEPGPGVPVTVRVSEGNMRRVRVGGGVSNVECANVDGRWTSRNFMGNGRRFELRGQIGNLFMDQCQDIPILRTAYAPYDQLTGLVSVDFTQPWFFGPRNSLGVGLFAERRSVPEVFVRTATGGHLSVGRSLGRSTGLTLAYRPEWTRLGAAGDIFFCVNFVACAHEDVGLLSEPHWLSPVTLTFSADRTDAPFTPSSGYVIRGDIEHAGRHTGSDFGYTRVIGEGSTYVGEVGEVILATRLRGGIVWPHGGSAGAASIRVNPQKRFFAGGPNSVRGLDQYRLGPTLLGIDAVPLLAQADDPATPAVEGAGCSLESINDGSCYVGALSQGSFLRRPVGGEVLLEANVELRFPLPFPGGNLRGAAFVDAGQVWLTAADVSLRDVAVTPGVGLRYSSPVGPIRMDAGFDTQGAQQLRVLTTRVEECVSNGTPDCLRLDGPTGQTLRNTTDIVMLDQPIAYGRNVGDIDSWSDVFRRFRLHFSIGQAF